MAPKYDKEAEKEVQNWFESILGEPFNVPLQSAIQDGSVLCKIANLIRPGSIAVVYENKLDASLHRENVLNFLKFCKECHINDYDQFQPDNVLNLTDFTSVLLCLQELGRQVPRSIKDYKGPHMSPDLTPIHRATQAEKARQVVGLMTFQGVPKKDWKKTEPTTRAQDAANWGKTLRDKLVKAPPGSTAVKEMAENTYSHEAADAVIAWIAQLTGDKIDPSAFAGSLKNGVILNDIAHAIKPGAYPLGQPSKIAYKQMANISVFRKFCLSIGMKEYELFHVTDLFEGQDIGNVLRTLVTLGKKIKTLCPDFTGPTLVWNSGPVTYY